MKEKTFSETPIQEVADYWNRRPCNIKHSNKPIETREYFDEVEQRKYFVEPHILDFADFPSVKGKRVLEIGCGIGTAAIGFARAGAKKVTAVDLSEKSLAIAKKRAEIYGFSNIEFFQANAEELSKTVPIGEYDLIYSFGVIHHSPHPENILKELQAYLSPTGKLKIMVYYRYSWKAFWILLKYGRCQFWKLSKLVATYSEAQTGCPITYTYSRKQAHTLFNSNGFKITNTQVDHIFPYQIAEYVQYRYVKEWYFRWMPKSVFRFLEKKLGWHLCITAEK
ncbi:MAG TPA: class I SAM-dependent methyltransferase [Rhabdochlamydiaceae bacterium]|nr:class I SAM-dependent methyltransferase [Rhabdochlamydiaceae bacterium]